LGKQAFLFTPSLPLDYFLGSLMNDPRLDLEEVFFPPMYRFFSPFVFFFTLRSFFIHLFKLAIVVTPPHCRNMVCLSPVLFTPYFLRAVKTSRLLY